MARADDAARQARLDLSITRLIAAPPALVWQAWTDPELLRQWWAPAPVATPECEMELRPGGVFRTLMVGPDGTEYPVNGSFLEIVPHRKIVFTDALGPGFRPAKEPFFTAIITLEEEAGGTRYTALVLHKDEADRERHEKMGFHEGWGTCIEQLSRLAMRLKEGR